MKKIVSLIPMLLAMLLPGYAVAQNQIVVRMNASTNGTVVQMDGGTILVRDDDSQGNQAPEAGNPMLGIDYYVTFEGGCAEGARIRFCFTELMVSCLDTVYVYDGAGTTGTLIGKYNAFTNNIVEGQYVYETPANNTGMITIRFRTDPLTDTNRTHLNCFVNNGGIGRGFEIAVSCNVPCESVTPVIEDKFYRVRNGEVYDSGYVRMVEIPDTAWVDDEDHTLGYNAIDTIRFMGAHLCVGDGVIFNGHGEYTHNYGYYDPSDATSYFTWDLANEGDTIKGLGVTTINYAEYQRTGCFDLNLRIVDSYGCGTDMFTSVRVRTSINPIKTIFTLADICSNDSLLVNMGYSGDGATLTLRKIENDEMVSKVNEVRTFIPDGCGCATAQNPHSYYEAPVEFTEFPAGRSVTSAADICSVCINMEHSFLGDFHLSLICPNGSEAVFKFGSRVLTNCEFPQAYQQGNPTGNGAETGGGINLGIPLDGFNGIGDQEPKCDSLQNPFGMGLDYCFSRDVHYTLITGDNAGTVWSPTNPRPDGNFYIGRNAYTTQMTADLTASPSWIPAYFTNHGGTNPGQGTVSTVKMPSNHEDKEDYYLPFTTFSELVGCPLNGTWKVRVYDTYGIDNGWVFNWSLDICNVSQSNDCRYQVGIDSLVWTPDPSPEYHDYDMGHYRGVKVNKNTPSVSYISSPDTSGTFPILVKVYDEFGCEWDTSTRITTYWSPQPNLGPDTSLCGVDQMLLNATDVHAATENYSYIWAPFGQNTDTITTAPGAYGDVNYVVRVTNTRHETMCSTQDTIFVESRRQPLPNFVPTPFVFEGCDPFTLHFDNHSIDAVEHLWVFGDGVTSTEVSPTHTYAAGLYDLRYYATSADGCIDSIVSPQSIAVYTAPKAGFNWSPVYPSVLNPVATFNNLTEPRTAWTKYFWEIQYNIANPLSVETLTDESPTFDFSQWTDDDPSGNYAVRLIARTDNLAPSGNMVYCRDTAENSILVVNDYLQFPNVVSPNGDGINDRFVIKNLVNGMGYPINQLDIYNKWGVRVYHMENISRDEDFWDPQNMPAGTYFYRFSAKGYNGNVEHNGAIEVVR